MAQAKNKYYVVWKGRKTGIFTSWPEAEAQVKGFTGAQYKSFASLDEAKRAFAEGYPACVKKSAPQPGSTQASLPIIPSYCVDAACSGNPGLLEYRCVDAATGQEVFRQGPFVQGTNNVGEFLAIVEALMLCREKGYIWPVYSDSVSAIAWVRAKKARTNLTPTAQNAELFRRIAKAEAWLASDTYPNPVLKWRTDLWGESPADFGRK